MQPVQQSVATPVSNPQSSAVQRPAEFAWASSAGRSLRHEPRSAAANLASALGWMSLGLGVAGLLMPRTLARLSGMRPQNSWLRAIGARDILCGAGILLRPGKPGWLWSRVAGDAMDLSLLALAGRAQRPRRSGVISAGLAGVTVLDLLAAYDTTRQVRGGAHPARSLSGAGTVHVRKALDVNSSTEACYRFWRDISNFPRFMQHVESVEPMDATRSRWQVRGTLRQHLTWEAELTSDVPGQQLGWRTRAGSDIAHAGLVRFTPAPGNRGTRIEVDFQYHAPMGKAGLLLARVLGEEPAQQVSDDLRRFKQLIETGEIPTTIGQPAGRRSTLGRFIHKGAQG